MKAVLRLAALSAWSRRLDAFLRGVDAADPNSGIFSTRPDAALIEKMDELFATTTEEMA